MVLTLLQGFILGLAYVMPIGTQNLYVIQNALQKDKLKAYQITFFIFLFDISLGIACFYGIGYLLELSRVIEIIILLLGFILVLYIGVQLIIKKTKESTIEVDKTLFKGILFGFIVTWFNPQAIIDGSLLLGSIHATLTSKEAQHFILGVVLASFTWFHSLTTIIIIIKHKLNKSVLRWINIICGMVLILYAFKIGYSLSLL